MSGMKLRKAEEFESAQDIGDDERMERIMLREEKIDIAKSVGNFF